MEIRPIMSALMRNKTGALLIAAQVALTFAIVVNAAFVIRDRVATAARPSGVDDEDRVMSVRYAMPSVQNLDALQQQDLATLRALPEVESAAITNQVPMGQGGWSGGFAALNQRDAPSVSAGMVFDAGGLLETFGVRVLQGRYFTPEEIILIDPDTSRDTAKVALVTEAFAKALYPDVAAGTASPVGKTLYLGNSPDSPALTIIGVIGVLQTPWAQLGESHLYSVVFPQRMLLPYNHYVVRFKPGIGDSARETVLNALAKNDPDRVSNQGMQSIREYRERRYRGETAVANLLMAVTVFLLVVTASGIIGMVSLWVSLRRKQIGVRRALGATKADIVRYFVTENLLITSLGIVLGVVAARALNAALTHSMTLPPIPWQGLAVGALILLVLGLCAALGPALRASRLSPALATRSI